jgi:hypothetical protein
MVKLIIGLTVIFATIFVSCSNQTNKTESMSDSTSIEVADSLEMSLDSITIDSIN